MIAADPESGDELLQVIDHAAVCLPAGELDPTVRYYEDVFGFTEIFTEYIEIGEQGMESRVVQSPSGEVTFTFLQPDLRRRAGQIDDFLTWHGGAGVQHLAFRTSDIVGAVRTFGGRGVGFAATPASYYDVVRDWLTPQDVDVVALRELGVLVDRDHWGLMFQIFTQSMHVRRTLFFELIERHGARTFGTSNIKALYEAKERELAGLRQPTLDTAGGRQ
jgi:4-hydroxymandelate synthase